MEAVILPSKNQESKEWAAFMKEPQEVIEIILNYMTLECGNQDLTDKNHNLNCQRFHNEFQKRRIPFLNGKLRYKSEICLYNSNFCKNQENCEKCHNQFEFYFHPSKFRTTSCNLTMCDKFGVICPFSHSLDKVREGDVYLQNTVCNNNIYNVNNKYYNNKNAELLYCLSHQNKVTECDLSTYKIIKCNINYKHNEKHCIFYHSQRDFKRMLSLVNYSPEICKNAEVYKPCPNGEQCPKAHNRVEQFYHPERFKTKFCTHLNDVENCPYGNYCSFAHCEEEIKVELIHKFEKTPDFYMFYFKTVWCPLNNNHDKSSCFYSHNWQDYRRSPLDYKYDFKLCEEWDNHKTILHYTDGCKDEYDCGFCHGWKEQDYHPLLYKTRKCKNFNSFCKKGNYCPFYHKNENKRNINKEEKLNIEMKLLKSIPLDFKEHLANDEVIFSQETGIKKRISNFSTKKSSILHNPTESLQSTNLESKFNNNSRESCPEVLSGKGKFIKNKLSSNQNVQDLEKLSFISEQRSSLNLPLRNYELNIHEEENEYLKDGKFERSINKNGYDKFKSQTDSFKFVFDSEINKKAIEESNHQQNNKISKLSMDNRYKQKILNYLKENEYKKLHELVRDHDLSLFDFIVEYSEEDFQKYIESSKKDDFQGLVKFIQELNDDFDYVDILQNIDNDVFNCFNTDNSDENTFH